MLQQATDVFDNLDDKFLARLREISSNTRTTTDGKATITFKTTRIVVSYYYSFLSTQEMIVLVATSIGHLDLVAATHIDSLSILISPVTIS